MINVLNLFLSLFLPLPSVKLLNTWFQMDNRYVLVSIKYFIQLHIFHDNNNANTVWYMILYTDTMCMIPEWLYVNLISLLGNSVMPLALFTGNKENKIMFLILCAHQQNWQPTLLWGVVFCLLCSKFLIILLCSCGHPHSHFHCQFYFFQLLPAIKYYVLPKTLVLSGIASEGRGGTAQVVFDIFYR